MVDESPVVVIGAGRSGTNLLRDLICSHDGFGTWPCDEINYIWRHGNRDNPVDELRPEDARPEVVRYIRRAFDKQRERQGGGVVVEKTCASSLRVGFVDAVLPEARFVCIVRDGRDVVASAMDRWTASLDLRYLARKARFVPLGDLPYYGLRYLGARIHRLRPREQRVGSWGPRFVGMRELLADTTLSEVCAYQWRRCVDAADEQLRTIDSARVHRLRYEDLVASPAEETRRLEEFLGVPPSGASAGPKVSSTSVGRWRTALSPSDQDLVGAITGDSLFAHGYEPHRDEACPPSDPESQ